MVTTTGMSQLGTVRVRGVAIAVHSPDPAGETRCILSLGGGFCPQAWRAIAASSPVANGQRPVALWLMLKLISVKQTVCVGVFVSTLNFSGF